MRNWLIRTAPVVLAVLQLALPRVAVAAVLEPCRDSARVAPRGEALPKAAYARVDVRAGGERITHVAPMLTAAAVELPAAPAIPRRVRITSSSTPFTTAAARLPGARAPPTQS